ncbi:MAG: cytochrome c3 family protein, partial [Acidobacteriota bacterium]
YQAHDINKLCFKLLIRSSINFLAIILLMYKINRSVLVQESCLLNHCRNHLMILIFRLSLLSIILLATGAWSAAFTQAVQTQDPKITGEATEKVCLGCHGLEKDPAMVREDRASSIDINGSLAARSVHGAEGIDCIRCHTELPHEFGLPRVECGSCHEREERLYGRSIHGKQLAAGDALAPTCQECHGEHYIVPLDSPESSAAPLNIPRMCTSCHEEGKPVERTRKLSQEQIPRRYTQNIHSTGLFKQGLVVTAVCTSCHTAHSVLPHTDRASSVSRQNVVGTCMKCHGMIESVHQKVIKGELWEKEPHKIPVCVECHAPHESRKTLYNTQMLDSECLTCHGDEELKSSTEDRSLFVLEEAFAASVHGRKVIACTQCHTGITVSAERPCATVEKKVDCSICHEAQVSNYYAGMHGQLYEEGDEDAPYCTDCHGTHDILEHEFAPDAPESVKRIVRESPTFSLKVPFLCARCHKKGAEAEKRYQGNVSEVVEHYIDSTHGKGLLGSGLTVAATCADCHTPHRELPRSDPSSSIHPDNMPGVCGKCHEGIEEIYAQSIHSPLNNTDYRRLPDMPALPNCSDCHSSHDITRIDASDFKLTMMDQCGRCHTEVAETYMDTYHGKVSKLGAAKAAKCYDCHGFHDIRAMNDPESRLSEDNIVTTCKKCHSGARSGFRGYLTHATHHDRERYPALFYTFWGMTGLLVSTFTFFGCHTLLWLPTSWRMRKETRHMLASIDPASKQTLRFTIRQRAMHLFMIISFFGLAFTGMTLKFSYMPWARFLAGIIGGAESAGFIHRVCAVIMFGLFGYHLWDAFQQFRKSKKNIKDFLLGPNTLVPTWTDVREFVQTIKWFLGRGPRPRYGRWTYWEKFDYLAVFWGVGIIGSTGLMLWFPVLATTILPGWVLNVATIIHSDEALLATGFIFTIHFFNTHFRPEKFPVDYVMLTGRVPQKEWEHERPREYESLASEGKLEQILVDPMPTVVTRVGKYFGLLAVTIGASLVFLIIYSLLSGR